MRGTCIKCRTEFSLSHREAECYWRLFSLWQRHLPDRLRAICDRCWQEMLVRGEDPK